MTGSTVISRFTRDCSKLATSTPDGRLTIWGEGAGGGACQLLHQFSPSTHLSAVPTCLAWAGQQSKKKKKKQIVEQSDLVAMGTTAGTVLVYSTMQGDLLTTYKTSNCARINCLTWSKSGDSAVYAGAEDGTVSIFFPGSKVTRAAIQPFAGPAFSLALDKAETLLAVGSSSVITLWHLANQEVVKTLTGHASPVHSLHIHSNFLFSSTRAERVVSVWSMKGVETGSILTMGVNQEVRDFDILSEGGRDGSAVTAAVVTSEGSVAVFKADLGRQAGTTQTHSRPDQTVTISTQQCKPVRVTQARLRLGPAEGMKLAIYYGSGLSPVVEQLDLSTLSKSSCLVRENTMTKPGQPGRQVTDLITPRTDGQVVFLAPGGDQAHSGGKGKRKADKKEEVDSLPVEDRLSLLSTNPSSQTGSQTSAPRTDTLAQLLAQGLHSNDTRILDSVLDRADLELIDNTVKRMPAEAVVPLVTVLQKYIKGRGMVNASHAKWLKSVLTIHTGYLVTVPDCQELLSPVYALLETRTQHYNQVLQLRGKLDLLTKQASDKQGDTVVDTDQQALLVYQDESSDELEDAMDDLLVPGSDTEDDWEEEGDAEMEESDDSIEIVNGDKPDDNDMASESD